MVKYFIGGAGLLGGALASHYGDRLWMEVRVLMGMNVATVYGFALIIAALLQALAYNAMCNARERACAAEGRN